MAINSSPSIPTIATNDVVTTDPIMAPMLPPAAIKPKSRVACPAEKRSTMKVQNIETKIRFTVLNQQ
jgi:hypothetical protein